MYSSYKHSVFEIKLVFLGRYIFFTFNLLVRSCLEQMTGERDKLHSDLAEANQRAALIATEVDDRHARMERASQTQIK